MEILRVKESGTLKPLHVVTIALIVGTMGGVFLLLSAQESLVPVDGAIPWHAESPLRAVVRLLSLNYAHPTFYQGDLKVLVLGLGAGLACISVGVSLLAGRREESGSETQASAAPRSGKQHIAPLLAAQAMFGLYVLWSFASARWSSAADIAVGGSVLLAIHLLWAFALGQSLSPRAARIGAMVLVYVTGVSAVIAIWYYYGRNPNLRAKFPFGNPTLLAGCFIPGMITGIYAGAVAMWRAARGDESASGSTVLVGLLQLVCAGVSLWAFLLADSRSAMIGFVFGLLGTLFFALSGKWRAIPVILAVLLSVAGLAMIGRIANAPSETGRDSTLRLRLYAFDYAWQMFNERPLIGHGQGAFVLAGDGYAVNDVLEDPEPFRTRIAHVHNEWLEVLANLGIAGLLLVASAILMTLRAGWDACRNRENVLLVPLLGAMVGMVVDATGSVGLRVSAVGAVFFLVIGLIWAMSATPSTRLVDRVCRTRGRQIGAGVVAALLGIFALVASYTDFQAARTGFRSYEIMASEKVDETVRLAEAAQFRLNPQRAITSRFQFAEALIRAAGYYQSRAAGRLQRVQPDIEGKSPLPALAAQDYQQSRDYLARAGNVLRDLVRAAPGFFNHGQLVYMLNMTAARDPATAAMEGQFLETAQTALESELQRQPFNEGLAVTWAGLAAQADNIPDVVITLSRPLRYSVITPACFDLIATLSEAEQFQEGLATLLVYGNSDPEPTDPSIVQSARRWLPEILRIRATSRFVRGDYAGAVTALERAIEVYADRVTTKSVGFASAYSELGIARFYLSPDDPAASVEFAEKAKSLCPPSLEGRQLRSRILRQEVDYALALGKEPEAVSLLKQAAGTPLGDEIVDRELALTYLDLCEALLQRRRDGTSRQPPSTMTPKLVQWVQRSIALEPNHAPAHMQAADLELLHGHDEAAVAYLREAVRLGINKQALLQYVSLAVQRQPKSEALKALLAELSASTEQASVAPSPVSPREETRSSGADFTDID